MNWYFGKLHHAGAVDPTVACEFLRVANLMEPPTKLFAGSTVLKVVRANLRPARSALQVAPPVPRKTLYPDTQQMPPVVVEPIAGPDLNLLPQKACGEFAESIPAQLGKVEQSLQRASCQPIDVSAFLSQTADFDSVIPRFESWRPSQSPASAPV